MKYYNGNTIKTRSGAWRSKAQLNAISREYARKAEAERLAEIDRLGLAKLWKAQTVYKKAANFLRAVDKGSESITCGNKLVDCVYQAQHYYNYNLWDMCREIVAPLQNVAGHIATSYNLLHATFGAANYNY